MLNISYGERLENLEAKNWQLRKENERLRPELKQFSLDTLPRTYEGGKEYIKIIAENRLYPDCHRIAQDLNLFGFPAFRNAKWTKDKVNRQYKKFRKPSRETVEATTVVARPIKTIPLIEGGGNHA